MEDAESWTVDGAPEVEKILADLATQMSDAPRDSLVQSIATSSSDAIDFMGFLKSGRALYFFRWLTDMDPRLAAGLINEAQVSTNDFGIILIERMRVLERQNLLSRVFSPDRLALVLEILTEAGLTSDRTE